MPDRADEDENVRGLILFNRISLPRTSIIFTFPGSIDEFIVNVPEQGFGNTEIPELLLISETPAEQLP